MKLSQTFGKTLREAPTNTPFVSQRLLVRGNFLRPLSDIQHALMPFGYQVVQQIRQWLQTHMPHAHEAWFPTTNALAYLAKREIDSYRDLPQRLFQLNERTRAEGETGNDLLRTHTFIEYSLYTLEKDKASWQTTHEQIMSHLQTLATQCHLPTHLVSAGDDGSQQMIMPHEQGSDAYLHCPSCGYMATVASATFSHEGEPPNIQEPLQKVFTPDCKTIAQVADFMGVPTKQTLKAVFFWWEENGRLVFALTRGDLDINEQKLQQVLHQATLRPATEAEIRAVGAEPGYASAVGLTVAPALDQEGVLVIADPSIKHGGNFVIGANAFEYHYASANYPRDHKITQMADITQAQAGYLCVCGNGRLSQSNAITLATGSYMKEQKATYLDQQGKPQPVEQGAYALDILRFITAVVEQNHDEQGIIWPHTIAPFDIHLLALGKGEELLTTTNQLYHSLQEAGWRVLYDERPLSVGVKFKDADLLGLPIRIALGKRGLKTGMVELKLRHETERVDVAVTDLVTHINHIQKQPNG